MQLFQRAIDGTAPERNLPWEFRLALTSHRQSYIFQMTTVQNYRPEEKNQEAVRLLYEILKYPIVDFCRIKARPWCEMYMVYERSKSAGSVRKHDYIFASN